MDAAAAAAAAAAIREIVTCADAMCNMYFISRFSDGLWKRITLLFMPHYY